MFNKKKKESACQCRRHKRCRFDPWVKKIPWRREWQPLQYSCLENPIDRGAWWVGDGPWSRKEWDTTERLTLLLLFLLREAASHFPGATALPLPTCRGH